MLRHLQGTLRWYAPRVIPPHGKKNLSCFGSGYYEQGKAVPFRTRTGRNAKKNEDSDILHKHLQ